MKLTISNMEFNSIMDNAKIDLGNSHYSDSIAFTAKKGNYTLSVFASIEDGFKLNVEEFTYEFKNMLQEYRLTPTQENICNTFILNFENKQRAEEEQIRIDDAYESEEWNTEMKHRISQHQASIIYQFQNN